MNPISDEVNISPLINPIGLTESIQTKNLRFAFLYPTKEKDFAVFHPTVKCRDYLSDVIHYKVAKTDFMVYGFSVKPTENKLDPTCARLLLNFPDSTHVKEFIDNFEVLTDFEQEYFQLPPSKLFAVKQNSKYLVLESDVYWQWTTQNMSMLTLLCRAMLYPEIKHGGWLSLEHKMGVDGHYIADLKKCGIERVLPLFKHLELAKLPSPSGWPLTCGVHSVHDYGGIYSLMMAIEARSYANILNGNILFEQLKSLMK